MSVKAGVDEDLDHLRQTFAGRSIKLGLPNGTDTPQVCTRSW